MIDIFNKHDLPSPAVARVAHSVAVDHLQLAKHTSHLQLRS
jgi:hypothetical protein